MLLFMLWVPADMHTLLLPQENYIKLTISWSHKNKRLHFHHYFEIADIVTATPSVEDSVVEEYIPHPYEDDEEDDPLSVYCFDGKFWIWARYTGDIMVHKEPNYGHLIIKQIVVYMVHTIRDDVHTLMDKR